ncbi:MAG: branched-chain amino acid ABC transporter permease [Candidatus Bathyarchaeia archaeon]
MLKGKIVNLKILISLIFIAILASAPYLIGVYRLSVLRDILIWIALSVCWHFFSGQTKYIALGSVAFFGTGLYITAIYLNFSVKKGIWPILPFPAIVLLAGLINFALALAIGSISLRLKGIYFAIATFGFGELVKGIIKYWQTVIMKTYIIFLPYFDSQTVYYSVLTTMLATLLLITFLRKSKFGIALRMIGECEDAAAHVGVNTNLYKVLGFAISAMCIGLIGGSYAIRFPSTNVDAMFLTDYSFLPAVMVLLGGIGSAYGPILGSATLALISEYLRANAEYTAYFKLIVGLTLIVIILFMPYGIMGAIEKVKSTKFFGKINGKIKSIKGPKTPF